MTPAPPYIIELNDPLHEDNFQRIKPLLKDRTGQTYYEFKKNLTPNYSKVATDIAAGWVALILTFLLGGWLFSITSNTFEIVLLTLVISITAGLIVLYLVNFFHEGAHFNLSPDKKENERMANLLVGLLIGQSISHYRLVHWEHHKSLGTTVDPERSYFENPGFKFLFMSATGIRAIKLLLLRNTLVTKDLNKLTVEIRDSARKQLAYTILFHMSVMVIMAFAQQWFLIISWCLAIGAWYPLFGSLRQVLEHRDDHADKQINYAIQPHGKFNRIFGSSLFDKFFGSAGFNKHLLHHLEPQISYTSLGKMEKFLSETIIGDHVRKKKSSYWKTFIHLFKH